MFSSNISAKIVQIFLSLQNNQVLGIGSGSTIVHAVQRIGMVLGPTRCFVQDSEGGDIEEK